MRSPSAAWRPRHVAPQGRAQGAGSPNGARISSQCDAGLPRRGPSRWPMAWKSACPRVVRNSPWLKMDRWQAPARMSRGSERRPSAPKGTRERALPASERRPGRIPSGLPERRARAAHQRRHRIARAARPSVRPSVERGSERRSVAATARHSSARSCATRGAPWAPWMSLGRHLESTRRNDAR